MTSDFKLDFSSAMSNIKTEHADIKLEMNDPSFTNYLNSKINSSDCNYDAEMYSQFYNTDFYQQPTR